MTYLHNRRHVLAGLSAIGAMGFAAPPALAEPPPETTTIRLPQWKDLAHCWAAAYVAGDLLRAEGFTDIRYIQGDPAVDQSVWIANNETDFSINYGPTHIASIASGVPIRVLTGLHSGCLELITNNDNVRNITDLPGKRVGIFTFGSSSHLLVALMAAYVGLDPEKDIEWVTDPRGGGALFAEGKVDAVLASPPSVQKLRAEHKGRSILNTTTDKPWSQHFCCMISARAAFVDRYPVATKRALRAILKTADLCASNPQWVARQMVDRGFVPSYEYALQTLADVRYDRWRDYDPEDTLRFYALRMQELGMINASPKKIIAEGTDWSFLEELKKELKT